MTTNEEEEKRSGWGPGRRVEARIDFLIVSDVFDYRAIDEWREKGRAWEEAEMNAVPTWSGGNYIAVSMRVTPNPTAVMSWTGDPSVDAPAWFMQLLAVTFETWPNMTFQRADLEIR